MSDVFHDFDLRHFWEDSDRARKGYVEGPPNAAVVVAIEEELGVRLPRSYRELMDVQNGGIPLNTCFPTHTRTGWAEDHVAIHGIFGIGRTEALLVVWFAWLRVHAARVGLSRHRRLHLRLSVGRTRHDHARLSRVRARR